MLTKSSAEHSMKAIFDSTVFSYSFFCESCSSTWLSDDIVNRPAEHEIKRIEKIDAANENDNYIKNVVHLKCKMQITLL